MREQSRIDRIVNSRYYPMLLWVVSFVFVTLFSRSTSFLYLFEGGDPSVFKQMGRAVLEGKILYIDYFDNKGCLLYFIHALGLALGGNIALLLMQACSLTATIVIWDRMLALYRNPRQRVVGLVIALLMLLCFYGAGDQSQEWCLPFISYPLLVYFRAYKSKTDIPPLKMLLIGLCFGIITFIQVNNACAFLGFIAWLWLQYLLKKDFKKLFVSILCFVGGWLLMAIPCVLYFYIVADSHGIYEMVYAMLLSNFEYMGHQWTPRWTLVLPYLLFLAAFLAIQIIAFYKKKELLIPILLSLLLFMGTFGKQCNSFYLTALIPLVVTSMTHIEMAAKRKASYVPVGIMVLCLAFYVSSPMLHIANDLILRKEQERDIYANFHHCIQDMPEAERDSIYNYNLYWHGTSMMEHEALLPCNRVLFTALVFHLPTLWEEETQKPFSPPKWILLSFNKQYKKEDANFIIENYELSCSFHYDKRFFSSRQFGDDFDVCLYRRKD